MSNLIIFSMIIMYCISLIVFTTTLNVNLAVMERKLTKLNATLLLNFTKEIDHQIQLNSKRKRRSMSRIRDKTVHNVFSKFRNYGLICKVCILTDAKFIKEYGNGELSQVVLKLERLVDYASWIFRATDWDGDGKADNLGFRVEIMKKPRPWSALTNDNNSDEDEPIPGISVLREFAKLDFSRCCLGIGFTMRPFQGKQVGVSLKGSLEESGGICSPRKSKSISRNAVVISGAGPNPNPIQRRPLSMPDMLRVLIHELGHAFGALDHDNSDSQCSDSDFGTNSYSSNHNLILNKGKFIMSGKAYQGNNKGVLSPNNFVFSSCSKAQISKVLRNSKCTSSFTPDFEAYCGNGILEIGEECDCGSEARCGEMGSCCGSRLSPKQCKILTTSSSRSNCSKAKISQEIFNSNFYLNLAYLNLPSAFLIFCIIFVCNM